MDLRTARALKLELRAMLDSEPLQARTRQIGLGIAVTLRSGNFAIAARAPSRDAMPDDIVKLLHERTAGELDARITGLVSATLPADFVTRRDIRVTPPPRMQARPHPELRFRGKPEYDQMMKNGLKIGASIGHYSVTAGTLGFFARRNDDGAIGIVSNNHVIAAENHGDENDEILHPGKADRGTRKHNVVASLAGNYPRLGKTPDVDCAFARLHAGIPARPAELQPRGMKLNPTPASLWTQRPVMKIGRTTKLTYGRITAFEHDGFDVHYGHGPGTVRFRSQIEIESSSHAPFSLPGDSGSLVVNPAGQAIGLIFAISPIGGAYRSGLSYANPMEDVLAALNVSVLV
jgi:hypothetical protein